jgi:hypothetical protein
MSTGSVLIEKVIHGQAIVAEVPVTPAFLLLVLPLFMLMGSNYQE